MSTPERRPPVESDSAKVAKIIVSDTIQSQQGDIVTLKMTVDALKGPRGNALTQRVMGDYLGYGANGKFDPRVLQMDSFRVNAAALKDAMILLLEEYSRLPETERPTFLDQLIPQEAKRGQQPQPPRL